MESCTSARGELYEHSWSSSSSFFTLGLGTWGWGQGLGVCGRARGYVAGCGGMWQGVGACGRGSDLCMCNEVNCYSIG